MKKLVLAVAIGSLLSACSSPKPDFYQKKAEEQQQRQEAAAQIAVKQMPKWFMNRPKNSTAVIYGVGYGVSSNMMSAKTMAESYNLVTFDPAKIIEDANAPKLALPGDKGFGDTFQKYDLK